MVAVPVKFDFAEDGERRWIAFTLEGDPSERFVPRLVSELGLPPARRHVFAIFAMRDSHRPLMAVVDADITFEEMDRLSGGEPVLLDNGGRGGGGVFTLVSELLEASLTIATFASLVAMGDHMLTAAVYTPKRNAYRAWVTGPAGSDGPPSRALRRMMRRQQSMFLSDVTRQYAVDAEAAARLLRATGFERLPDDPYGYPESWKRIDATGEIEN